MRRILLAAALAAAGCSDQPFVTDVPFRVVAASPSGGAEGVAREAPVVITFSEKLLASSVPGAVKLESLGVPSAGAAPTPVDAAVTYADEPVPTITITPVSKLPFSTVFRVSLGTGLSRDRDRGPLATAVTWTFQTLHPPPLRVLRVEPGDGSAGAPRDATIRVTFSEPVRCASLGGGNATVREVFDAHPVMGEGTARDVPGSWICTDVDPNAPATLDGTQCETDPSLCVVTFVPEDSDFLFRFSSRVTVTLEGGAAADAPIEAARATPFGGQLETTVAAPFSVEDPPPLGVFRTTPGNAAEGVHVFPPEPIEIELDQPVACATASSATATVEIVHDDGTTDGRLFTVSCTDGEARFALEPDNPAQAYPYSSVFTVRVSGGAFGDNAPGAYPGDNLESVDATTRGGQLPRDYVFRFRTEDPPPLLVKSATPSAEGVGVNPAAPVDVVFSEALDCDSVTETTFLVVERFARFEDPARVIPPPARAACSFSCPAAGDPARARCDHAPFAQSSVIEVTLQGGADAAGSIRSAAATLSGGFLEGPPVTYSFRAADPPPLRLLANEPNGNPGANVSAQSDVRLTFDRPVRCATVAGRVTLVDTDDGATVAGVIACTDGVNVGPNVAGATVIFTPSAKMKVDHTMRVSVAAGIAAADATVVDDEVKGKLEQPVSFEFEVAHEDLRVIATNPRGGATGAPIGSQIAISFNQDINAASLVPCTPSVQSGCNLWISVTGERSDAIGLAFVSYDNTTFTAIFDPSDPANAPNLQASTTYTVRILGSVNGLVGANGISRLPTDYSWTFTASDNNLILSTTPPDEAVDVDVSTPVCVELAGDASTGTLIGQITLSYADPFGRSAQVPLQVTPYTLSGTEGFAQNKVCLNISEAPTPCFPGLRRLLYGTTYTGRVSTSVVAGGQSLATPFTWTFTTRQPPEIAEVRVQNLVVSEELADGAVDVPVNAAFVVRFAEVMAPGSLTPANISIVPTGGASAVTASITLDDALSPRAITVEAGERLAHSAGYALLLLGGVGGVSTKTGNYLGGDVRIAFTTSAATSLTISPPESTISPAVIIPIAASRDLYLPSANASTIFGTFGGAEMSGIIAQQSSQRRSVAYIANPTYRANASGYVVESTDGLLDYRGNPVPATKSQSYSAGNTPSLASQVPTTATCGIASCSVSPPPGPTANGNPSFMFTLPGTGLKERMLGTSYYANPPGQSDGTVSLEATGGAGCPSAGTRLPLRVIFLPGTTTASDRVRIEVAGPPYMKAGCGYALKIRQAQTANVYDLAPATSGCGGSSPPTDILSSTLCAVGNPSPGLLYTGEITPPTLSSLEVQQPSGAFVSASGATGVFGGTVIRATFSEAIDPTSVNSTTVGLTGNPPRSFTVEGSVVTVKTDAHFAAGQSYTVTFGAVKDLAGNSHAGSNATFTVESAVPTFDALSFDGTVRREAPFGTVVLTFSEPIDPMTLTVNQSGGRGSVSVFDGATPLFGCAERDPADPRKLRWRPEASVAGKTLTVTVNHASSSGQLTDMAGTPVATTERSLNVP